MPTHSAPRLPKWPFIVGDAALLGVAWFIVSLSGSLTPTVIIAAVACAGLGSLLLAFPFVVEYARRQEEAIDERQRSLEGLSRMISDSAEQISIAANGIQELAGAFQKHLKLTSELTDKLSSISNARPRKAEVETPSTKDVSPGPAPIPKVVEPVEVPAPPKASGESAHELALENPSPAPALETKPEPAPRKRSARKLKAADAGSEKSSEGGVARPEPAAGNGSTGANPEEASEPPAVQPATDGGTRLNVTAYIGIGNRLFIRGEGAGLSWDHGVPLQFVSIGKWRWEAAKPEGPVRFKLYKNDDQECAELGTQTLTPGTEQEIKATFQ